MVAAYFAEPSSDTGHQPSSRPFSARSRRTELGSSPPNSPFHTHATAQGLANYRTSYLAHDSHNLQHVKTSDKQIWRWTALSEIRGLSPSDQMTLAASTGREQHSIRWFGLHKGKKGPLSPRAAAQMPNVPRLGLVSSLTPFWHEVSAHRRAYSVPVVAQARRHPAFSVGA
jgi:hypothetical protein